jgi:effector-binding domain-containing protein
VYEVSLADAPPQSILALTADVPREEVGGFLQQAYPRLFAALAAIPAMPVGPTIARYRIDETTFHVTAGVPCVGVAQAPEGLELAELPGGPLASTVHHGSYETLPEAFHAVIEWIDANGYRIAADPWECYLDGPEVAQPRTQVCFPVAKA